MTIVFNGKLEGYKPEGEEKLNLKSPLEASVQHFRELHFGILNLMPANTWEATENEWLENLDNDVIQITPHFVSLDSYKKQNEERDKRIQQYYESIREIKKQGLDCLIITGANIDGGLEDASYSEEIKDLISWARQNVTSVIFSCWTAHAALEYLHGIQKEKNTEDGVFKKKWGVFKHYIPEEYGHRHSLLKGLNDNPSFIHSRHNKVESRDLKDIDELDILVDGDNGWSIVVGRDGREIYLQSHLEYGRFHLHEEFERDSKSPNYNGTIPENYYRKRKEGRKECIQDSWGANSSLFFRNLINFIYQNTHYDRHIALESGEVKFK